MGAPSVLLVAILLQVVSHGACHAPFPTGIALPSKARGADIVAVLGDRLAEVASYYDKTTAEMLQVLSNDNDVWITEDGRLFYACEGMGLPQLPPPSSPAPASNQPPPSKKGGGGVQIEAVKTPIPALSSRPTATRKIYLDFDGQQVQDPSWNGGTPFLQPSFEDGSGATDIASRITQIWQRVSEDYSPWQVDVTTIEPALGGLQKDNDTDTAYGVRVIIGGSDAWYCAPNPAPCVGGTAFVGSFSAPGDQPVFIFAANLGWDVKYVSEATAHEVGHALGLSHDGLVNADGSRSEYTAGWGEWAPLMGIPYYAPVTQLTRAYPNATNTEDDVAVVSTHAPLMVDDFGGSVGVAGTGAALLGSGVAVPGLISSAADVDLFTLSHGGGAVNVTVTTADAATNPSPDLNAALTLYNAAGGVVAGPANPVGAAGMGASLALTSLSAGTYWVAVDGAGESVDAVNAAYNDGGSMGRYVLSATFNATAGTTNTTAAALPSATCVATLYDTSTFGSPTLSSGSVTYRQGQAPFCFRIADLRPLAFDNKASSAGLTCSCSGCTTAACCKALNNVNALPTRLALFDGYNLSSTSWSLPLNLAGCTSTGATCGTTRQAVSSTFTNRASSYRVCVGTLS